MNEKNIDEALNAIEPVLEKLKLEDLQYVLVYLVASNMVRLSEGSNEVAKVGLSTYHENVSNMIEYLCRLH